jgi:hypothetical protein
MNQRQGSSSGPSKPTTPAAAKQDPPSSSQDQTTKSSTATSSAAAAATDKPAQSAQAAEKSTTSSTQADKALKPIQINQPSNQNPSPRDEQMQLKNELDETLEKLPENTLNELVDILTMSNIVAAAQAKAAREDMRSTVVETNKEGPATSPMGSARYGSLAVQMAPIWARASMGAHPVLSIHNIQSIFFNLKTIRFLRHNRNKEQSIIANATLCPIHQRFLYPHYPAPFFNAMLSAVNDVPICGITTGATNGSIGSSGSSTANNNIAAATSISVHCVKDLTDSAAYLISSAVQQHVRNLLDVSVRVATNRSSNDGFGAVEDIASASSTSSFGLGIGADRDGSDTTRMNLKLANVKRGPNVRLLLEQDEIAAKNRLQQQLVNGSKNGHKRGRDSDSDTEDHEDMDIVDDRYVGESAMKKNKLEVDNGDCSGSSSDCIRIARRDVQVAIKNATLMTGIGLRSSLSGRLS